MSTATEQGAATKRSNTVCAACGKKTKGGMSTCESCGAELSAVAEEMTSIEIEINDEDEGVACPDCGAMNDGDAQVCDQCGGSMGGMEEETDVEENSLPTWEGEIAYEGLPTSDGRLLMANGMTNRELPLTLMCQTVTDEGHMGAEVCGKITNIWRVGRPDLGDGVVAVMASGEFSPEKAGPMAARLVESQVLNGVSVDVAPQQRYILNADTLEVVSEDDFDFQTYMEGGYLVGVEGEYMGATLVPFPAFAGAKMWIAEETSAVVASIVPKTDELAFVRDEEGAVTASVPLDVETRTEKRFVFSTSSPGLKIVPRTITASAAGIAPIAPPRDWFFTPEPEGKCPLTVTDDGRIFGHLATWDQCHHGFGNQCMLAKPSQTDYSFFHVGQLKTAEGEWVNVGRIVVGDSGHASINMSAAEASQFYDMTSCVGAFVRAVDGEYGIWLSGAVRSDCPSERVRDMMANPPSGDWRRENGWLELIAALSVPVPGFPVPRYEYHTVVASASEELEVESLVATGYYELDPPSYSRAELRKKEILISKAKEQFS